MVQVFRSLILKIAQTMKNKIVLYLLSWGKIEVLTREKKIYYSLSDLLFLIYFIPKSDKQVYMMDSDSYFNPLGPIEFLLGYFFII